MSKIHILSIFTAVYKSARSDLSSILCRARSVGRTELYPINARQSFPQISCLPVARSQHVQNYTATSSLKPSHRSCPMKLCPLHLLFAYRRRSVSPQSGATAGVLGPALRERLEWNARNTPYQAGTNVSVESRRSCAMTYWLM